MTVLFSYFHPGAIPLQGSVRAMRVANRAKVVQGGSENSRDRLAGFRADMAETWARTGKPTYTGPVTVAMVARIERPASHYGTGRNSKVVKPNAPTWPKTPDVDKIMRAIGDALQSAMIIKDDCQITQWVNSRKMWSPPELPPGLVVMVIVRGPGDFL